MRMSGQNRIFRSPGSLFSYSTVNLLFLCMFLNDAQQELQQKVWFRVENSAKDNFLPLWMETCLAWKFLFLPSFLNNYPWTFEKSSFFNKLWA